MNFSILQKKNYSAIFFTLAFSWYMDKVMLRITQEQGRESVNGKAYATIISKVYFLWFIPICYHKRLSHALPSWINEYTTQTPSNSKGETRWTRQELASFIVECVGLIAVLITLWFLWYQNTILTEQTRQLQVTLNLAAYQALSGRQYEINSVFLEKDNVELYEYFNCELASPECSPISEDDDDYPRVEAISYIFIDFYEEVIENSIYYSPIREQTYNDLYRIVYTDRETLRLWVVEDAQLPIAEEVGSWLNAMKSNYQHSPTMCSILEKERDSYTHMYATLALTICSLSKEDVPVKIE